MDETSQIIAIRGPLVGAFFFAPLPPFPESFSDRSPQLRGLFPAWRFGQLAANLWTAAGADSIWEVDDAQLLS